MKMPKYNRHSTVPIEEVFGVMNRVLSEYSARGSKQLTKQSIPRQEVNGEMVRVFSLRLQTFHLHGTKCSCCGLEASYFAIERNDEDEVRGRPYHLNLWGVNKDGEEVLFTHDHILARALGGKDEISNTQTMCTWCNFEKSLKEGEIAKSQKEKS